MEIKLDKNGNLTVPLPKMVTTEYHYLNCPWRMIGTCALALQ